MGKLVILAATAAVTALALAVGVLSQTTGDHDRMVSCYIGTWAFYRKGYGKFDVENWDTDLCTHGFYGFAALDNQTWEIYPFDPWYDLAPEDCEPGYCNYNSYRRFTALKTDNFKAMLSIGGWNEGSGAYSEMSKDPVKRATFVASVVPFLEKYGFDGLDLDWENPGDRLGSDPIVDKESFSHLVDELYQAMDPRGLILSAAMAPSVFVMENAYDIPYVSERFTLMNVMTYDYHGWWEGHEFTGVNSPMMGREEENYEGHPGYRFNMHETIMAYIDHGAPVEKLTMGIPSYGRGFQLVDNDNNGLYCPADDGIPMGTYTVQKGFWGYMEVLQAQNNDTLIDLPGANPHEWEITVDDCYRSPYMHNGPYWIGYDNEESVAKKVELANFLNLGGVMMWSLDTDDFYGLFSEPYPLLREMNQHLIEDDTLDPESEGCLGSAPMCDLFSTSTSTTTTTTTASTGTTSPTGGLEDACTMDREVLPFPGDCHKYFICLEQEDGSFQAQVMDCGESAFDPNTDSCIDPGLEAHDILCGDEGRL